MAPTPEDVIDTLKGTVDKLEARVAELESRLRGKDAGSSSGGGSSGTPSSNQMRMIIIGPPGAGKHISYPSSSMPRLGSFRYYVDERDADWLCFL